MTKKITTADKARIRSAVVGLLEQHHLPGIAVGVVAGSELVYAEGFGLADVESGRSHDPSLRQRIGSITKTMVALCAMGLVDEGRLALGDRVVDRLPDLVLHGPGGALTLRHLLTHTGGIGEAPNMPNFADPWGEALWCDAPTPQDIPEAYPDGITIEVAPGSKWAYANHGFALLGAMISRAEGRPIEEVLRSRVFEPLGMADSDCLDLPHANLTTGYHRPPGHDERDALDILGRDLPDEQAVDGYNIRGRYQYLVPRAAGGVQSTIPDMARYAAALLARGAGIVRPTTFDAMTAAQWCPDERLTSLGLGFMRRPRFGRRTFGHGGGIVGGWNTHLSVIPQEGLALLVHCNLWPAGMAEVEGRILQAVLNEPDPAVRRLPTDPAVIEAAVGVYEPSPGHLTNYRVSSIGTGRVQITARDGRLFLRSRRGSWREGVEMVPADPADPNWFLLDTGGPELPGVALVRDRLGRTAAIRFDRLVELRRSDALAPWA